MTYVQYLSHLFHMVLLHMQVQCFQASGQLPVVALTREMFQKQQLMLKKSSQNFSPHVKSFMTCIDILTFCPNICVPDHPLLYLHVFIRDLSLLVISCFHWLSITSPFLPVTTSESV